MIIPKILDDCGDTSNIEDWEEAQDGLNPVDNQVYVKQGSHSMALGIDADLSGQEFGQWSNSQAQGDFSNYQSDWIYSWLYLPTLDYLKAAATTFFYRVGSDSANYITFARMKSQLSVGWNLIKCDFDNPSGSAGAIDWSAIAFQRIVMYEVTDNTHDFTIYVDSIMLVRPFLKGFSLLPIFRTRRR